MSFVFWPHAVIGTFKGLDIVLKSHENVSDSIKFDAIVKEFTEHLKEIFTFDYGVK